jgi:hypothetical protein
MAKAESRKLKADRQVLFRFQLSAFRFSIQRFTPQVPGS